MTDQHENERISERGRHVLVRLTEAASWAGQREWMTPAAITALTTEGDFSAGSTTAVLARLRSLGLIEDRRAGGTLRREYRITDDGVTAAEPESLLSPWAGIVDGGTYSMRQLRTISPALAERVRRQLRRA
jgi:hypothetical protein